MAFAKYLETKYLDWQREMGERKTIEEFGHYIGVSQGAVSLWMNGKREPAADSVKLLANVLGPEVYDVLGLERPDPRLVYIQQVWSKLPLEAQADLREMAERYVITKGGNNDPTGQDAPGALENAMAPIERDPKD